MTKKGQAAMEFLMTYGWAILAAIIAIAVLAYFGVFNPGRYASEYKCLAEKFCEDYDLEYSNYQTDSNVWCKLKMGNKKYQIIQFEINWEDLKEKYSECIK